MPASCARPCRGACQLSAVSQGDDSAHRARQARSGPRSDAHARTQAVRGCVGRCGRTRLAAAPGVESLRWDLEELRVSVFAQELGAKSGVSAKKLSQRVAALRS
ncbi:DUF3418 domain-containing protein [Xanthomonas populi]